MEVKLWKLLKGERDVHSAGDLAMRLSDFNGHVSRHIGGFDGVHRGYDVGQRNLEQRLLLYGLKGMR